MIALIKLTVVFAAIVLLMSRKWNLGLVLLLASVGVGILFGYPLLEIGRDLLLASIDPLTLRLGLAILLIMILGEVLRQNAGLGGMIEALQALIPDGRVVIAVLPALVGLLPMIGGAMFSAPMVNEVGDRLGVSEVRKTFVNYWFRHIWEPIFPLYPAMILAAALLDLTPAQLAQATWPMTMAAVTGGLLFGLLGMRRHGTAGLPPVPRTRSLRVLATSIWPIALVIILSLILSIDEHINLILSLVITIGLTVIVRRIPLRDGWMLLRKRIPWLTMLVILGALSFRRVLDNSGAVVAVSDGLSELQIPAMAVAFGLPFIAGLLTGLSPAAYSIGFPVALPLAATDGGSIAPAWAMWLMAGGLLGALLSPVHLCLALTREYFKTEWGAIYRHIVPAAVLVAATAAAALLLT